MSAPHDPSLCGCCEPSAALTPLPISNRPGLRRIDYRVGTFSSFTRTMLERIGRVSTPGASRPLQGWTSRTPDDPGIALLQMWAYVADVLTFYQERIANEAFLRTATQPESIVWLAALLGYRPAPGVAAQTYAVFTVEKDKSVDLRAGLRVQSVPGQEEKPQKFETADPLRAFASLNELALVTTEPQALKRKDTSMLVAGTDHRLAAGDWILLVGDERSTSIESEVWDVRRLTRVDVDRARSLTTIHWEKGLGDEAGRIHEPPENVRLFVFRAQAWPFGYNAPDWNLLAKTYPNQDWTHASLAREGSRLSLEAVHPGIGPRSGDRADGAWVALVTDSPLKRPGYERYVELYEVRALVESVSRGYALTAKTTRVTLDRATNLHVFPMQGTVVLARNEELPIADKPRVTPLTGKELLLDGAYRDLAPGRTLLVVGRTSSGDEISEAVLVKRVTFAASRARRRTRVELEKALANAFVADTVRIYGNVALVTHGETVPEEVLGNGDATAAGQEVTISRAPVTFVHDGRAPHGARSTLEIRVGGVRFHEDTELFGHGSTDAVFTTRVGPDGRMKVQFGDGEIGTRLPTGVGNIVARYRQGLGREGNVRARTLTTLLDRPTGLKAATNPAPASGGADPERADQTRENAPNTVRTLGRIVSLRDFEDGAREFAGIRYALAEFRGVPGDYDPSVRLTVLGVDGATVSPEVLEQLAAYLDLRRDTNRRLRIESGKRVPVVITAAVRAGTDFDRARVERDVRERLAVHVGALGLGDDLHASVLYEVLHGIEGLEAVLVTNIARKHPSGPPSPPARLPIAPFELAVLEDSVSDVVLSQLAVKP